MNIATLKDLSITAACFLYVVGTLLATFAQVRKWLAGKIYLAMERRKIKKKK